ncbi:GTP-binding protein, partial [Mycena alexandri]
MNDQTAPRRRLPKVKFRVLIAGRANAGKTTILQRVCDTTESPETHSMVDGEHTKIQLNPTSDRGEHDITDELKFSNHDGYVFHDSCGLENGSTKELKTLEEFVRKHAEKKTLHEQLHVIWYCIPMDDHRPGLNVDPLHALQINKNVPVITVFTKCDAFRRNTRMDLEDDGQAGDDLDRLTNQKCQEIFQRECLDKIGDTTPFVLLEGMNDPAADCDELIRTTAEALNSETVTLMLLAVQTKNLELSVQRAVQRSLEGPP